MERMSKLHQLTQHHIHGQSFKISANSSWVSENSRLAGVDINEADHWRGVHSEGTSSMIFTIGSPQYMEDIHAYRKLLKIQTFVFFYSFCKYHGQKQNIEFFWSVSCTLGRICQWFLIVSRRWRAYFTTVMQKTYIIFQTNNSTSIPDMVLNWCFFALLRKSLMSFFSVS